MPADIGTFDVYRGDPFTLPILGELDAAGALVNLGSYGTGWTSQIRLSAAFPDEIPFTVNVSNINGTVDPAATAAQLVLSLTGVQTEAMTSRSYVFDVQATGGPVSPLTLYSGSLRVTQDVTR